LIIIFILMVIGSFEINVSLSGAVVPNWLILGLELTGEGTTLDNSGVD